MLHKSISIWSAHDVLLIDPASAWSSMSCISNSTLSFALSADVDCSVICAGDKSKEVPSQSCAKAGFAFVAAVDCAAQSTIWSTGDPVQAGV